MTIRKKRRMDAHSPASNARELGRTVFFVLLAFVAVGFVAAGLLLFEMEQPEVALGNEVKFVGGAMDVDILATDKKSGIRRISVTMVQNGTEHVLFDRQFPRRSWLSKAGPTEVKETAAIDAKGTGAKEGPAELIVQVCDFSLKRNVAELRLSVTVDSTPPRVTVDHAQMYMMQGGSGLVVYSASEPLARHGVSMNGTFFKGYPLKGKLFLAYIAVAWNGEKPDKSFVVAFDQAGNEAKAPFAMHFKKAREKNDRIEISDEFLQKKIPEFQEFYPELKGTDLEKYLFVNQTIRVRNAEKIAELCRKTADEQLWQDRFLRTPGAGKAGFADQRVYFYKGREIDRQTHLGIDIASNERAEIRASNRGRVVFADYLGIYGHTVIIDHGQGISSLYSHLSRIEAMAGKLVEKNELIGRSGTSGMAAGDHLHYSMLVHGVFVTPIEWWDQHWIDVNVSSKLSGKPEQSSGQQQAAEDHAQ